MGDARVDKDRYLYVSDGFVIHLLDLNRSKSPPIRSFTDVPPLPRISTLKLLEKGFPILAGLFKLGSDVLLIGGREFPAFDSSNPNNWGMNIFGSISKLYGLAGTTRLTYRLTLIDGDISLSECDYIKPLNRPKGWPEVVKVGNKIHVMECFPIELFDQWRTPDPTHEALDLNNLHAGWVEIGRHLDSPLGRHLEYSPGYGGCDNRACTLLAHVVFGDLIHFLGNTFVGREALVFDTERDLNFVGREARVFDTERGLWTTGEGSEIHCIDPFSVDHVIDILGVGRGRCVGGFLRGQFSDSLYVVFAVVEDKTSSSVHAVAYLVVVTGQVLCFQRLPHFFEGLVRPASVIDSVVIATDEEETATMCAIIDGKAVDDVATRCLFVHTFTVEEIPDARLWIRDVWRERVALPTATERNFVRVVVKDRYVYKTDTEAESEGVRVTRMQACFL